MTEVAPAAAPTAAPGDAPAKLKTAKKKSVSTKVGPTLSDLIVKSVAAAKERKGVSLAALKKDLGSGGYDVEKNKSRINSAVRKLVANGTLVQTKGTGASGSFKIGKTAEKVKKPTKEAAVKEMKSVTVKKAVVAKKSTAPTKPPKKPVAAKKAVKSTKTNGPKKEVKKTTAATKAPTKKLSKPKVKKAAAKKK